MADIQARRANRCEPYSEQFGDDFGSANLWRQVIKTAVFDFKNIVLHRLDPRRYKLTAKYKCQLAKDTCCPEFWIFGKDTGFELVCEYLGIEPDAIRRPLQVWCKQAEVELRP